MDMAKSRVEEKEAETTREAVQPVTLIELREGSLVKSDTKKRKLFRHRNIICDSSKSLRTCRHVDFDECLMPPRPENKLHTFMCRPPGFASTADVANGWYEVKTAREAIKLYRMIKKRERH